MKTSKKIVALLLSLAMCVSICPTAFAANDLGVTYTATLDQPTIKVSTEAQTVTMTVNANKAITWDGVSFRVTYDSPLTLADITNKEVTIASGDKTLNQGSGKDGVIFNTADMENSTLTNLGVVTFTVPANTPAGTYNVGISGLEITSDYGEIWESDAAVSAVLTIEAAGTEPDPDDPDDPDEPDVGETEPQFVVSSAKDRAGEEVTITVSLENNPGIISAKLKVGYDAEQLTLVSVANTGLMTGTYTPSKDVTVNPYVMYWMDGTAAADNTENGIIANLTFKINEDAVIGDTDITLSVSDTMNFNLQSVDFAAVNGKVTVIDYILGDVNDDDAIDAIDNILLTRYIAEWDGITINEKAADVNVDGSIDAIDNILLTRYIAEWDGIVFGPATASVLDAQVQLADTNAPLISATSASGKAGDTVTLDLSMANNPGIVSVKVNMAYDAAALTLVSVENTGLMTGTYTPSKTITVNPYVMYWMDGTATEDNTENGVIARLTFKINEGCAAGAQTIDFSVSNTMNCNLGKVTFNVEDAAITVQCAEHTYDNACDADCNACGATREVGDHTDADGKWETDGTNHWHTCSCGEIFEKAAHSGGEATCKAKAKCQTCQAEYGDINANNHKGETEIRDAVTESCNTPGYTGDTYCKDCNTKIETGKVIEPTGDHVDADSKWETDGTDHWHTCGCQTVFDKAGHSGGEATCKDKAECEVCGAEYGELNASNHKGETEVRDAVIESCNTPGYTGDTWCLDCETKIATGTEIPATGAHVDDDGKWETDGTDHWHTCGCQTVFDKAEHDWAEATCAAPKTCKVCGLTEGEKVDHDFTEAPWSTDAKNHWHECKFGCGTKIDEEAHDKNPCTICGYKKDDAIAPVGPSLPEENDPVDTPEKIEMSFADVSNQWFAKDVQYVFENGLMNGVGDGSKFAPEMNTSRGMIVTILWRMEGEPDAKNAANFSDVTAGAYYEKAVAWAAENGIVTGYAGSDKFGPNDNITREQFAVILFRYAQYKGMAAVTLEENLIGFADHEKVSAYAVQAMNWAVGKGLINGSNGNLMPSGYASRAQAAAILHRFCENLK